MAKGNGARLAPIELVERLVAFDTVSANSNLKLIDWVRDYLAGYGIESELTWNETRDKANLFATIGPKDRGGVILSGHTDVVPVAGQPWTSDPFAVVERDGKLYGRGTADMKSFIALALSLVPEWVGMKLETPIHLAFSFDEETGCFGAPYLIGALPAGARRPRLVVIGEPTGMSVVNAHKGIYGCTTTVTGLEAHSSATHRGVSAIFAAAEIMGVIQRLAEECKEAAEPQSGFDPPYTTFNIGMIEGGTAMNIIPRHCRFVWECRPMPGDDPARFRRRVDAFIEGDLLPRLRQIHPGANVETEVIAASPGLRPDPDSPAETLARQLTGANTAGPVAFATEAGLFQESGIPAIVCGPGFIEQAHKPDEFISLEQLAAGERFLRRLTRWAARPA
jgi:acetylornithine deacetylase